MNSQPSFTARLDSLTGLVPPLEAAPSIGDDFGREGPGTTTSGLLMQSNHYIWGLAAFAALARVVEPELAAYGTETPQATAVDRRDARREGAVPDRRGAQWQTGRALGGGLGPGGEAYRIEPNCHSVRPLAIHLGT
ncbi:hypothetical protein GCM10010431_61700 [Streptomyces kunmingensis]